MAAYIKRIRYYDAWSCRNAVWKSVISRVAQIWSGIALERSQFEPGFGCLRLRLRSNALIFTPDQFARPVAWAAAVLLRRINFTPCSNLLVRENTTIALVCCCFCQYSFFFSFFFYIRVWSLKFSLTVAANCMCFCYFCNATVRRVCPITLLARVRMDVDTIYSRGMMARRSGAVGRFWRNSEVNRSNVNRTGQLSLIPGYASFFEDTGRRVWAVWVKRNKWQCFERMEIPRLLLSIWERYLVDPRQRSSNAATFPGVAQCVSMRASFSFCFTSSIPHVKNCNETANVSSHLKIVASDDSITFYRLRCL